jgi:hypothetical protein
MTITATERLKDGDIFHWSYKDERGDRTAMYWCKSRIAVVKDGYLQDTYWHSGASTYWKLGEVEQLLNLEFIANFADIEKQQEYMSEDYDDADCLNLNHANSSKGNFYIRKGAKRSAAKMKEVINHKIEREMAAIRVAQMHIDHLEKSLAELCKGESLDRIYL